LFCFFKDVPLPYRMIKENNVCTWSIYIDRYVHVCCLVHRANLTAYKFVTGRAKFELRAIYLTPKHFLSNTLLFFCLHYMSRAFFFEISYLPNKTEGESTGTKWVLLLKETQSSTSMSNTKHTIFLLSLLTDL